MVDYHDSHFPVTEPDRDAPNGARIYDQSRVIERRGNEWWTLYRIALRNDGDSGYIVSAEGDGDPADIGTVYRRRMIGLKRMRPRWRWCIETSDPYRYNFATRALAVEHVALDHAESAHPQEIG